MAKTTMTYNKLARQTQILRSECDKIIISDWTENKRSYSRVKQALGDLFNVVSKEKVTIIETIGLNSLMRGFKDTHLEEGYILDGFLVGTKKYGYEFHLHVHTNDASLFIPPSYDIDFSKITPEEKRERTRRWRMFNDCNYIRNIVHPKDAHFVEREPIWNYMEVPFTERGIWEATLLYITPNLLPCEWRTGFNLYELINSQEDLENKLSRISIKEADDFYPQVIINGESATVIYCEWNIKGLRQHMINLRKSGKSVTFIRDISTLLYENKEISLNKNI